MAWTGDGSIGQSLMALGMQQMQAEAAKGGGKQAHLGKGGGAQWEKASKGTGKGSAKGGKGTSGKQATPAVCCWSGC